ncbi:MAG: class I SAM-dependent methyltransferase [Flavobacteriaceae bacterium]|nr:class I SAM-dependent methyltransferase [Flavobacteriaceae bacterium]
METLHETLEKNKKQKEFYNTKKKSIPSKIWSFVREKSLKNIRKELGILQQSYALHKEWMGDLSQVKVLDLGCYSGNNLSRYLAENSKEYIGIDLSELAIAKLNEKLKNIPTAKAVSMDFFSDDFTEKNFDLIYAYGVLHHFKNVDNLIQKLDEKLAPGGKIISYDPMETSRPIWFIRKLYRPFQSDAAWEWPFSRKTIRKFENEFEIVETRGVLGKSKWYFLVSFLPISKEAKLKWGKKAHQKDWEKSATSKSHLHKCMQLNMLMQKK